MAFKHLAAIGDELAQQVIAVKAVEADVQSRGRPAAALRAHPPQSE